MLVQRGKRRDNETREIKNNVPQRRGAHPCSMRHELKGRFDGFAKRKQHQHVDDQMRPVGMERSMRDDPVPFLSVVYLIGIEQQTIKQRFVGKCADGYYRRDDDDDDGHTE